RPPNSAGSLQLRQQGACFCSRTLRHHIALLAALATGIVVGTAVETGEWLVLLVGYLLQECRDIAAGRVNSANLLEQCELDLAHVVRCQPDCKRLRLPVRDPVDKGSGRSSHTRIL